ncbi:MAG: glycosyl hydrolase, family 3 [Caulobacteraceae bacterium]|nr:glycosyl hydrolase, family 3 [Caulobacteraceae bacterium]
MTLACVLGCAGRVLSAEEVAFFRDRRPWGFILFGRNVENPDQVRTLTESLRASVDRPDAPVLIDQEGGRVQRLGPPHWRRHPPASAFAALPLPPSGQREAARLGARLIAHDLAAVGVDVDCAPVLDVPAPGAHDVIGDRAYADDVEQVGVLARAVCEGLMAGGVLPVIKHIPGHGRATADSHERLPVVDASREDLERVDFAPFRMLSDMPIAMTAHVLYAALDATQPATTSHSVISEVIRRGIGFEGLLISDDLSMKALGGGLAERAAASLDAGCDIVLHCNGDLAEMEAVVAGARELEGRAAERARAALARRIAVVEPLDLQEATERFDTLLGRRLQA